MKTTALIFTFICIFAFIGCENSTEPGDESNNNSTSTVTRTIYEFSANSMETETVMIPEIDLEDMPLIQIYHNDGGSWEPFYVNQLDFSLFNHIIYVDGELHFNPGEGSGDYIAVVIK